MLLAMRFVRAVLLVLSFRRKEASPYPKKSNHYRRQENRQEYDREDRSAPATTNEFPRSSAVSFHDSDDGDYRSVSRSPRSAPPTTMIFFFIDT